MTRVLILGASGMLGHKLYQVLGSDPDLDVHGTCRAPQAALTALPGTIHSGIDLGAGSSALAAVLNDTKPDVVLNAIGAIKQRDLYASIDSTFYLNGTLPHLVPLLNPNSGARLIQFSTDCVYKGDRGGYTEADSPDAEDLYGRSKACGEVNYGRHLTLRTSIIGFELSGHLSLIAWLMQQPDGAPLRGFSRAIYSGLPTVTLSRLVHRIIRDSPDLRGLFHVASAPISKLDLLIQLTEALQLNRRFSSDESVTIDRSLDDTRFRSATGTTRPDWAELISDLSSDLRSLPYPYQTS